MFDFCAFLFCEWYFSKLFFLIFISVAGQKKRTGTKKTETGQNEQTREGQNKKIQSGQKKHKRDKKNMAERSMTQMLRQRRQRRYSALNRLRSTAQRAHVVLFFAHFITLTLVQVV